MDHSAPKQCQGRFWSYFQLTGTCSPHIVEFTWQQLERDSERGRAWRVQRAGRGRVGGGVWGRRKSLLVLIMIARLPERLVPSDRQRKCSTIYFPDDFCKCILHFQKAPSILLLSSPDLKVLITCFFHASINSVFMRSVHAIADSSATSDLLGLSVLVQVYSCCSRLP